MESSSTSRSVYLIGRKKISFSVRMLPSKRDVLARIFYLVQDENKSVKESVSVITNELIKIYSSFEIPTKRKDGIEKIIIRNYNDYNKIRKSKNNDRVGVAIEEKKILESFDVLLDISHVNAMETLKKDNKKKTVDFLNEHRQSMAAVRTRLSLSPEEVLVQVDNEISDDDYSEEQNSENGSLTETESDSDGSVYVPPIKMKKQNVAETVPNIVNASMTQALDRFQISNTGAAIVIGQAAYNLGCDVRSLHISPEHIRMQRLKHREYIFQNIKKQFPINAAYTVHWDGKILEDCTSVNHLTCNRLAIILSSRGITKVLGIPKVAQQTGAIEGAAVYSALLDWHAESNVMAMCFDTTASNTSTSIGACAVLEQNLNRQLLHFGCRHHIMELLAGAAFKVTVEPTTSGRKILLFEKFRKVWPELQHTNFIAGIEDPDVAICFPITTRNDLIYFIKDQIKNKVESTRHDYIEMLKLSALFLGEKLPEYKISQPGAVSQARWMAKIIYTIKLFLFRKQFAVSPHLLNNIRRFNIFAVRVYLKYWFLCQVAPKAPANDINLLKELELFKSTDAIIGEVVQKKLLKHLWYLNESNIALAFFDDDVDVEMKRKMVLNLKKDGHPDKPKRVFIDVQDVMTAELSDFVTNNTYTFFETILNKEITNISQNFLTLDPMTWEENEDYIAAKFIVKHLLVVNDIAERGIALITRFNAVLTHHEEQKQFILHAMEQHCKDLPSTNFSKKNFLEYLEKSMLMQ